MDIRSLGAFRAVYECGSITKAAARMYISPQGLSKNIGRLEAELGTPLFARTRQGAFPNEYARALYPKVCDLLDTCASIRGEVADRGAAHEVLRVASVSGTLSYLGLDFITGFESSHPGTELLIEDNTNRLVNEMMQDGLVEIGFMAGPIDRDKYDAVLFRSFPHVLIASDASPLSRKRSISFSDLEGQTIIILGRDHPVLGYFNARLAQEHVRPAEVIGVAVLADFAQVVRGNQAVLIAADFWEYAGAWEGTTMVPFADRSFSWDVYLATRHGQPLGSDALAFRDYALAWKVSREATPHVPSIG